ncbi:YidH family protein [Arcticibacter sp.]|jgi:putative membrane protein|uniref:YidH family protein n=1 Tax=Arcticibacter sp. TaxID=1872630 RepID=UPI0038905073
MEEQNDTKIPAKIVPNDHLANERTFLAWIRTGIAVMGFGFVVVKFSLFISQLSLAFNQKVTLPDKGYSSVIGILLIGIGAVSVLLAYLRYRSIERKLLSQTYYPSFKLSMVLTVSMLIIAILLIVYLIPSI